MVKVLMSRYFWEHIMFDYNNFTVDDFDKSSKIDLESFVFFKTLLKSKSKIYLNISDDKILELRNLASEVDNADRNLAQLIRSFGNNLLKSDCNLYNTLQELSKENVTLENLPVFLLLGDVDENICLEIEKMYGINCFSKKRLKVPAKYRQVQLFKLSNTKSAIFEKLNQYPYNSLDIRDPYFIHNHLEPESINNGLGYMKSRNIPDTKKSKISIKYYSDNYGTVFCNDKLLSVKRFFSQCDIEKGSNTNIQECEGRFHDRNINTNTTIGILGNSLNTSTPTHFTIYPLCIYSDFFDE